MSDYEQQRQPHVSAWGAALPDRLERPRWERARLDAHRTAAVRRLVETARSASPWHAARLADVDVDALDARDLSALPTMTKHDLMANFDTVVTDRRVTLAAAEAHLAQLDGGSAYFLDDLHVVASGGSSGERGVFVYGWDAWIDVHQGLSRWVINDVIANPVEGPLTMAVVAAEGSTHMTKAASATFASPMVETHSFPVTMPVADIVAGLNAVEPHALTSYASMLGVLAAEARAGRLRIRPRRIVATSEPLLPEVRAAAEEAFGAPVANCWGTSEGGVMAVGCWQGAGMHVNEDLVVLEPVDARGRAVAPGARAAKVLVTNLYNPVLPLIRYELTDEVVELGEPCPCGSTMRRVADVEGRSDDLFAYGDVTVHPHAVRSVLARHAAVVEYQVRQTERGVAVEVVTTSVDRAGLERQLAAALAQAGVDAPEATVVAVERLARHSATGKLKRFVPLDYSYSG